MIKASMSMTATEASATVNYNDVSDAATVSTVSYTHLDVYKRQGGGGGNSGTTAGAYTVTVTGTDAATGKVTSSVAVTVTVN